MFFLLDADTFSGARPFLYIVPRRHTCRSVGTRSAPVFDTLEISGQHGRWMKIDMGQRHCYKYSLLCDCHNNYDQHEKKYCSKAALTKRNEDVTIRYTDVLFTFSMKWLMVFMFVCPMYALSTCLALALNLHYDEVTNTTNIWCPEVSNNCRLRMYNPWRCILGFITRVYYQPRFIM